LELIRYIHLNPLRAKLVKNLKDLDKYLWTGHSAILGRRKNQLIPKLEKEVSSADKRIGFSQFRPETEKAIINPENPVNPVQKRPLAEKTIEDVLLYFGKTRKVASRRYRQFVEKGIKHGRRTDLQGGGLIRSSGGDKAELLGLKKEDREKSDQRILGSGGFVERVLSNSYRIECPKIVRKIPLPELVGRISKFLKTEKDEVLFGNRKQINCHARNLICFIAIKSLL
jgi:hypothetical protein